MLPAINIKISLSQILEKGNESAGDYPCLLSQLYDIMCSYRHHPLQCFVLGAEKMLQVESHPLAGTPPPEMFLKFRCSELFLMDSGPPKRLDVKLNY